MSEKKTIGERIRDLRIDAQLTQDEVAASMHLSREAYIPIEKNRRGLKDQEIVILADTLHTTTDYILTGNETQHINIHEYTGLSNSAISFLAGLLKAAHEDSAKIMEDNMIVQCLNLLLSERGSSILFKLGEYLFCDFDHPFVSDSDDRGHDCEKPFSGQVGFHCYIEKYGRVEHYYNMEFVEQSVLSLLMEEIKKVKHTKEPERIMRVRRATK